MVRGRRRFHLRLVAFLGVLIPRRYRADWRREWEAELRHRESLLSDWERLDWRSKVELLWQSLGAFLDAMWMQSYRWEDEVIQDLRYGARMLVKNPGFTMAAVISLALGIGANTAIFQLINAVRLRTLPVRAPEELVEARLTTTEGMRGNFSSARPTVTNPIWEQIRARQEAFSQLFAWGDAGFNLAPGGQVRPARGLWVSGDFFNALGVKPALGRVFSPADDQRGVSGASVVLSHDFWQREYGGDRSVIGRIITLSDQPVEIIGVANAGFYGLEVGRSFDLALPISAEAILNGKNHRLDSGTNWWLTVMGRLKPGWTLDRATAQLQAISPGLFETTLPANYPPVSVKQYLAFKLEVVPAGTGVSSLRENYENSLWMLLAIAGMTLLIACANLANLLLARASAREREIAVRQALGASRARLVRQLLVESLLLASLGAIFGALLAQSLSRTMVWFLSAEGNVIFLDLSSDWRVLGFAAGLALLTCVLFGLAPALRATGVSAVAAMRAGGRGLTSASRGINLRRALVVVQVALSLTLVAGALLFSRSLNKLMSVDTGFRQDGVLIVTASYNRLNLPPERQAAFKQELIEKFKSIPGVDAVAETYVVPLSGNAGGNAIWMDGSDARNKQDVRRNWVSPEFFKTMLTPLLAGREFNERDRVGGPNVAIVNESFARLLLGGASPVGRRFWIESTPDGPETLHEVVGLVRDTKYFRLGEEFGPIVYHSSTQIVGAGPSGRFLIRSRLGQAEVASAAGRILTEINPAITVNFRGYKTMIEAALLQERLTATLSGFFGLLALLLASVGLYGILSYGVASRTNEIGIRMALGARGSDVRWLVLREALSLVLIGVAIGIPMVIGLTRLISSLLYNASTVDPMSLGLSTLLLLGVALLAGYLPARRATRIDPMIALRVE